MLVIVTATMNVGWLTHLNQLIHHEDIMAFSVWNMYKAWTCSWFLKFQTETCQSPSTMEMDGNRVVFWSLSVWRMQSYCRTASVDTWRNTSSSLFFFSMQRLPGNLLHHQVSSVSTCRFPPCVWSSPPASVCCVPPWNDISFLLFIIKP